MSLKTSIWTLTRKVYSGIYNNGNDNSEQYIFEWESMKTTTNLTQLYVSQGRRYMRRNLGSKILVSWYRHILCGYKLKYFSRWCLDIWRFIYECIGIYPIWTKYTLIVPTCMVRPQYLEQKNQWISSIQFVSLLKWAHNFSPFNETR